MVHVLFILMVLGSLLGLFIGVVLLLFTNRFIMWSASKFSAEWLAKILYGKYHKPQSTPYQPHKALIWWCKLIGAGLTVLCTAALYNIFLFFIE